MTTPLPPKSVINTHIPTGVKIYGYTEADLKAYGAAEFQRGIDAAADVCLEFDACNPGYMSAAIRALGETS